MGFGIAIGGGILSLTVVTVMLMIPSAMESITDISESKSELIHHQQNLGETSIQIDDVIAAEKNDEFVFLLENTGTSKLWNFENFDILVTYDATINGTTTKLTESLVYNLVEPKKINCDGTVQGLAKGRWAFGTYTNDHVDPGIINPNEEVQISGRLNHKFASGGAGNLALVTDTGYFLNKTFSVVNGTAECAWYDPNWSERNKIIINHEKVLGNLTDFPVMIKIRDKDLRDNSQADADDILFTDSDKVTKLDHEIEYYDEPRGELTAWVKVPNLSSIEDTEIYLYYGNDAATNQENATGVWSNGYEAVFHLHDDFTNSTDSTSAINGGTSDVSGIVADAQDFERDDNTDHLDLGQWSVSGDELTIQTWAKFESFARPHARIIDKASSINDQDHVFLLGTTNDGTDLRFSLKTGTDDASGTSTLTTTSNLATNTWYHLAATYDGAAMTLLKNGVVQGTPLSKTGNIRENNWDIFVGNQAPDNSVQFDGILDEVRISSAARSSEWLKTEYNNISAPQDFYTFEPNEPFLIWADLGWQYRKPITIDKDLVDADLDDFPLLVSVTDSDLTKAQTEGNDVIFTSADGRVQLDHEMEFFDSSDGTVVAWVRVPTLQGAQDTTLYMYYGHNTTTNVENIEEVWDDNYKAVYHLKEQAVSEKLEFEPQDMNSAALVKLESASDKFVMWAPRDFSNGGFMHTVDIEPDGDITGVVETQQFSGLGQDPDAIHVTGDIYAVAYEGPSERGWVVTSEILSDGTIGDYTGTRSSYQHLDSYSFEPSFEIDNPSIIHVGGTAYAVAFSGSGNDLFVETINIPNSGALMTTIENGNNLDSDGDYPEIINIGSNMYAIAYQDESFDGWIRTINIDSSGNIGAVADSWEYQTSNGETPDFINISGNVYAIVYEGPGSDGWIRTVNITSTGTITKSGYHSSTQFEFDTNMGLFPDIIQVYQTVYAIVYSGPNEDGYLKTLHIYPNGTIGSVIDTLEYDTTQGVAPQIDQVSTNIFAIAYEGTDNDGYVVTIPINNDGVIGDTALDSTINDNTGDHVAEPLGTLGKIAIAADMEASNGNYITVADSSSLDITGSLTVSAWVMNEDANQAAWETILAKGDTAYRIHTCGSIVLCLVGSTTDAFVFAMNGPPGSTDLGSDVNPAANDWHYVVGTFDGTTQKIYVDGQLNQQMARSGSITANSAAFTIGANLEQGGRYWDGMIDEVRVSNTARSLEWIGAEFNNQNSPETFMSFGPEEQIQ